MLRNLLHTALMTSILSLLTLHLFGQNDRIQPSCPMNIIIAVDFSGSEREYISEIQTALRALTSKFELHEINLKIGIITFNRGARVVLPLTSDTQQMDDVIEALRIPIMVYATDIHSAIDLANQEFRLHSAPGILKYFVLISDGDPHAHARGYGFQADLVNIERLKSGDPKAEADPIHVFSLYTGRLSPFQNRFGEEIRIASIRHMKALASDKHSFFYYEQYPMLVEFFERISDCL